MKKIMASIFFVLGFNFLVSAMSKKEQGRSKNKLAAVAVAKKQTKRKQNALPFTAGVLVTTGNKINAGDLFDAMRQSVQEPSSRPSPTGSKRKQD